MPGRTIAIGDIHGCSTALSALLEAIGPTKDDTLVMLGDYVDRGPDSRGVLDQLIELSNRPARCRSQTRAGQEERKKPGLRRGARLEQAPES